MRTCFYYYSDKKVNYLTYIRCSQLISIKLSNGSFNLLQICCFWYALKHFIMMVILSRVVLAAMSNLMAVEITLFQKSRDMHNVTWFIHFNSVFLHSY